MWNKLWHWTLQILNTRGHCGLVNTWGRTEESAWSHWRPAKGSRGRVKEGNQAKHRPRILLSSSSVVCPSPFWLKPITTSRYANTNLSVGKRQTWAESRVIPRSDVISSYYEVRGITESWQQLGFCFPRVANKKLSSCSSLCEKWSEIKIIHMSTSSDVALFKTNGHQANQITILYNIDWSIYYLIVKHKFR